ncbi:MAG: UDP-N-acetylmuramate dehydrogenase [Planctomycetota bacterium]
MRLATPFSDLDYVTADAPLAPLTWYRIGGPAQYLVRPNNVDELREAARRCSEENIPIYVLGLGANLLVSDEGVPGAVFRLDTPGFGSIKIDGGNVQLGAGFDMQKMVLRCCREGLAGVECMAGIYGTVGGGVTMNAGGRFGDIGGLIRSVTVMSAAGEVFDRTADDLHFGYRSTNIVAPFIIAAELELEEDDPVAVTDRTKEVWMYKRSTQPLNAKSSGCMFTNPGPLPDGRTASAGKLIDDAGLKGMRVGNAEVSSKHANFILAHAPCTAKDVTDLVSVVREKVQEKFGIELQTEVKFWPS